MGTKTFGNIIEFTGRLNCATTTAELKVALYISFKAAQNGVEIPVCGLFTAYAQRFVHHRNVGIGQIKGMINW